LKSNGEPVKTGEAVMSANRQWLGTNFDDRANLSLDKDSLATAVSIKRRKAVLKCGNISRGTNKLIYQCLEYAPRMLAALRAPRELREHAVPARVLSRGLKRFDVVPCFAIDFSLHQTAAS
jgi:hypothetical protein